MHTLLEVCGDVLPSTEREYASKVHELGFEGSVKSQLRTRFLRSKRVMGSETRISPVGCPENSGPS